MAKYQLYKYVLLVLTLIILIFVPPIIFVVFVGYFYPVTDFIVRLLWYLSSLVVWFAFLAGLAHIRDSQYPVADGLKGRRLYGSRQLESQGMLTTDVKLSAL